MAEPRQGWDVVRLHRDHDRSCLDCGDADLDDYLLRYARQNDEKGITRTYVTTTSNDLVVVGYHSIRSGTVAFHKLPGGMRKRLPRYPIPVVHLARLAVDRRFQGRGLGETLLLHALECASRVSDDLGIFAVEVLARNDLARDFYRYYGFTALVDDPNHLYLSIKAIRAAFQ